MSVETLPSLREDLRLLPGTPDEDGAPRWLLFDAMRSRYFALSQEGLELIRQWAGGISRDDFCARLAQQDRQVSIEEVSAFAGFLQRNHLTQARTPHASAGVHAAYKAQLLGFWRWLLHHYLFLRIPLFRPERWLVRWTPRLSWLFTDTMHYLILTLGIIGLIMVLHQWDAFQATFLYFFNLQGVMLYGITLILVKSVHELGHAFSARRLGCRVASMGVALLVLLPVLYTDTTDAWRLRTRAERLRIVTAGVRAELYLALIATFLWNVLPDGTLRSALFFIATTSWVTSVMINISPFMRFDGYYALSDIMGIENLQPRAFAVGRWQLRQLLWRFDDPLPEPMPRHRARLLTAYAWGTWIYRFILFMGIALLVYHLFFKVLGIVLFAVEISWFVMIPIISEIRIWWKHRERVQLSPLRGIVWLTIFGILLLALIPLPARMSVPAVLHANQTQLIFAPEPAQILSMAVAEGDKVEQGQVLMRLHSDELAFELQRTREMISQAQIKLSRRASSAQDKAQHAITEQELSRLRERLHGLQVRRARLILRAPFDAVVTQVKQLHPAIWVNEEQPLMQLIDPRGFRIEGFVREQELPLIAIGQRGQFIINRGDMLALAVTVDSVDVSAVHHLPYSELTSQHGGDIAVHPQKKGKLLPESAQYRVNFKLPQNSNLPLERLSGIVLVKGKTHSWLWHQLQLLTAPLIRESGF
ncbi:MAG: HlyD family efflux transporter periplasmic adaptor subunit [Candidatus Thiodiazotropha sp.]